MLLRFAYLWSKHTSTVRELSNSSEPDPTVIDSGFLAEALAVSVSINTVNIHYNELI